MAGLGQNPLPSFTLGGDGTCSDSKRPTIHVCHIIVADDMFAL
jgi:hypothetical protein